MSRFLPFLATLRIQAKGRGVIPLQPNWAQLEVLREVEKAEDEDRPCRIIVLKARQLGVCLDPLTRVLTADLEWVRLWQLQVGDKVVAVDENHGGSRGVGRKMRTATVQASRRVYEPAFRLTFDNGESVVATGPHRFLSRVRSGTETHWRMVKDTRVGDVIRFITSPWDSDIDYEDGWFGGILDGEGSCRQKSRAGVEVCASQRYGHVYDRMLEYAKSGGYTYRVEVDDRESKFGTDPVAKIVFGRMSELFRLIGRTRPTRFLWPWWEGKDLPGKKIGKAWVQVVSIESLGEREMLDIQTSTGTFIAEGVVSHNSTISEALLFMNTIRNPGTNAVVVAHDGSSSEHLFNMTRHYYDTWEYKNFFPVKYATRRQLSFQETKSNIWVMTAEHSKAGHGRTIHQAHFSEVSMWSEPEEAFVGFNPAIPYLPGTNVILESTAKGMGNFWDEMWHSAVAGENGYTPLFFPWFKHYEYIPCENAFCTDASCERCKDESRIRPADEEEERLVELGASLAHIAWRRRSLFSKCFGDEDFFREQYCATPEEAFRTTGVNAFPIRHLENVYKPLDPARGRLEVSSTTAGLRWADDTSGPIRMYVQPGEGCQYFCGVDVCHGKMDGDFAAIQVINRHSHEQVAVWHGRINPMTLADEVAKLGRYYNNAMVSVDTEGPGYATIARLTMIYPNIWRHHVPDRMPGKQKSPTAMSWASNWKRKQWMVSRLGEWIERADITLHDSKTYNELRSFTFFGEKGYGDVYGPATKTAHDDLVMALGIAVVCESTEPPPQTWEEKTLQHVGAMHNEPMDGSYEEPWS